MLSLLFLFVFGIVNAENYAILYGSVEQYTNTELPSSLCRFYDVSQYFSIIIYSILLQLDLIKTTSCIC